MQYCRSGIATSLSSKQEQYTFNRTLTLDLSVLLKCVCTLRCWSCRRSSSSCLLLFSISVCLFLFSCSNTYHYTFMILIQAFLSEVTCKSFCHLTGHRYQNTLNVCYYTHYISRRMTVNGDRADKEGKKDGGRHNESHSFCISFSCSLMGEGDGI